MLATVAAPSPALSGQGDWYADLDGGRESLFIVRPLGDSGSHKDQRGRLESRRLVPVPSGDDEEAATRKVDSFHPMVCHDDHLHVALHDLEEFVGVRVHFPPRCSLGPSRRRATIGCPLRWPNSTSWRNGRSSKVDRKLAGFTVEECPAGELRSDGFTFHGQGVPPG